ncbi:hypothetical protein CsatB_029270 [Cannabis sativa]
MPTTIPINKARDNAVDQSNKLLLLNILSCPRALELRKIERSIKGEQEFTQVHGNPTSYS